MKKDILFTLIRKLALLCFATFLSYKLAYFIGERYFFDKLFYKKSITHGYVDCWGDECDWVRFGNRAEEYLALIKLKRQRPTQQQDVLGAASENKFQIAVIGDSFTWGQGIKNEQRMAFILEQKFRKHRDNVVYSFALPGENVLGNFAKINTLKSMIRPNIWVYFFVSNDILPEWYDRYGEKHRKLLFSKCNGEPVFDTLVEKVRDYHLYVDSGWSNSVNICLMSEFVFLLPQNTMIFIPNECGDTVGTKMIQKIVKNLRSDIAVITAEQYAKRKYSFSNGKECSQAFRISQLENHPSAAANQMYADVLYDEILLNPRWGLHKQ